MSKRGAREGTIGRRKDGRWEGRITTGCPGQRRRDTVYGKTRADVKAKLDELIRADADGQDLHGRKLTVRQFSTRWLDEVVDQHVRPSTAKRYRDIINLYVLPALGEIKLAELGVPAVQTCINDLAAAGLATEKIRAVLRNCLNVAIEWRLLTWNPADRIRLPRRVPRAPRFLTVQEAERLLDFAKGDRLEAIYVMALSLAMRQGELLGLRWSDIDLSKGELRISRQMQGGQLVDVKSVASHRWLPLPEIVRGALIEHRAQQKLAPIDGLVFASTVGTPIGARNLLRAFKALLRRADLPEHEIRFHDLRHSCATFLIAQGTDPKTVQAILGHTTIRLTMDTYVHAMPDSLRDAARQMDRVFRAGV